MIESASEIEPSTAASHELIAAERRVAALVRGAAENAELVVALLRRLGRGVSGRDVVLLWGQPTTAVNVGRLWNRHQVDAWQRQKLANAEVRVRRLLDEAALIAEVRVSLCGPGELAELVENAGVDLVAVARPDAAEQASEAWWELTRALREIRQPVLIV